MIDWLRKNIRIPLVGQQKNKSVINEVRQNLKIAVPFNTSSGITNRFSPETVVTELSLQDTRANSRSCYLNSDIYKTVIDRIIFAYVGNGLRLHVDPNFVVLGIESSKEKSFYTDVFEAKARLYFESKYISYDSTRNLHQLAKDALRSCFINGDALIVLRGGLEGERITVQVIDGDRVDLPINSEPYKRALSRGNNVFQGIEKNKRGEHVAYYVADKSVEDGREVFRRIPARDEDTGIYSAYLLSCNRYQESEARALPLLSTSIGKVTNDLETFKAITEGTKMRAKIMAVVENGKEEMFLSSQKPQMLVTSQDKTEDNEYVYNFSRIFNSTLIELPPGKKMNVLGGGMETFYFNKGGMHDMVKKELASSVGFPAGYIFNDPDGSYSSGRTSTKDVERSLKVAWEGICKDFYKPIYDRFFHFEAIKGNINPKGYFNAIKNGDFVLMEAWRNASFTGAGIPHIDPLKETKAEIMKLEGAKTGAFAGQPLVTKEDAVMNLSSGDADVNTEQIAEEAKHAKIVGITEAE